MSRGDLDVLFYTSDEEYACRSATSEVRGITWEELPDKVRAFQLEYGAYMVRNGGRLIVTLHEAGKPHFDTPENWRGVL